MILQTSSISLVNPVKSSLRTVFEATNNHNQYLVSRASLRAMLYLCMKSALLSAACASSILAPIEVPERTIWDDKVFLDGVVLLILSANLQILTANSKVRLSISIALAILLFPFAFSLFTLVAESLCDEVSDFAGRVAHFAGLE